MSTPTKPTAWPPDAVALPAPDDRGELDPSPAQNTHKTRAFGAALVAGLFQFIESVASAPPEVQDGLLRSLVEVLPVDWRPTIILWAGVLKWAASAYAIKQASKSGPSSPPANNPNK